MGCAQHAAEPRMDAATGMAHATAGLGSGFGLEARSQLAGGPARPPVVAAGAMRARPQRHRPRASGAVEHCWFALWHLRDRRPHLGSSCVSLAARMAPAAAAERHFPSLHGLVLLDCVAHPRGCDRRFRVVRSWQIGASARGGVCGTALRRRGRTVLGRPAGAITSRNRVNVMAARWAILVRAGVSTRGCGVRWCCEAAQARGRRCAELTDALDPGVRELSAAPAAIPAIKTLVRSLDLNQCVAHDVSCAMSWHHEPNRAPTRTLLVEGQSPGAVGPLA